MKWSGIAGGDQYILVCYTQMDVQMEAWVVKLLTYQFIFDLLQAVWCENENFFFNFYIFNHSFNCI